MDENITITPTELDNLADENVEVVGDLNLPPAKLTDYDHEVRKNVENAIKGGSYLVAVFVPEGLREVTCHFTRHNFGEEKLLKCQTTFGTCCAQQGGPPEPQELELAQPEPRVRLFGDGTAQ